MIQNNKMQELQHYIIEGVFILLLCWSEYLGLTPRFKSNAIAQMIMCAFTGKKEEEEEGPPAIVVSPPAADISS